MSFFEFRKTNHLAVLGFLCPFVSAGITAFLLLKPESDAVPYIFSPLDLVGIPAILVCGIVLSLKSIKQIEALGDKDYAYSGLVLNLLFITLYLMSIVIAFSA